MDELWFLVVFGLISAVSSWLQARREAKARKAQPEESTPPPQVEVEFDQAGADPQRVDWEEAIRQVIVGESPQAALAPPPLTPPPPVDISPTPAVAVPADPALPSGPRVRAAVRKASTHGNSDRAGARVRRLLASPQSTRDAIVLSAILGPPKAIDGERGGF